MKKTPEPKIVRVSALLPRDLHRKLRRAAYMNGISGNAILKDALTAHLKALGARRKGGKG